MILALLRYFKGYVTLEIEGFFIEKFLNLCAQKNILIWDVVYGKNGIVTLKMTVRGFRKIRHDAYKTRTYVKTIKKSGLPFFISKNKNRKGLAIGIILSMIVFFYISSFIWQIEVDGNERLSDEKIISLLNEAGFKKGMIRFGIDNEKIKNDVLLKNEDLSWIWVDIKGTKAFVSVREKKEAPKVFDKNEPSNIIAVRDGLVTRVIAKSGQSVVKEGDVVSEGNLLISGVLESEAKGYKYVNASGEIWARTWHEIEGETTLIKEEFTKTSKKFSKKTINFFGFDVLLYRDKNIPFKYYEEETKNFDFGIVPISFTNTVYHELEKNETKLSLKDAVKKCGDNLKKELEKTLGEDVKIIKKDVVSSEGENGIIKVKVIYECNENIAKSIAINTENTEGGI